MSESAKKWLFWGSIVILLLSAGVLTYTFLIPFSETVDFIQISLVAIILLSALNLVFLLASKYQDRNGFRKVFRIMSWFLPILIIIAVIFEARWLPLVPDFLYIVFISLIIVFLMIANVYLFIIDDAKAVVGIVLILLYIIITLVLKRINYADMEKHMVISFLMIGCGMYLFGLKSFFSIKKNRFLKVVSFIACLFIFFGSLFMFYFSLMTRTKAVLMVYSISMFLLTLIVLLSLPVSGYIQWSSQHKSILKKILIPWIFFLILFSIRFVFPDLNSLFFREARVEFQEFRMNDYSVINKNGLEPE